MNPDDVLNNPNIPETIKSAFRVLWKGKQLVPDRFPQPSMEVMKAWAEALDQVSLPEEIWGEAVTRWSLTVESDRMATPREIKASAFAVRDVWEQDPQKRLVLDQHRQGIIRRKVEAGMLPPSAVPPVDDTQQALEPRSDGTAKRWTEIRAGIAQRARDRRIAEREAAGSGELFADMNKQPGEFPENESR